MNDLLHSALIKLESAKEMTPWKLFFKGWIHPNDDCGCEICQAQEDIREALEKLLAK